MPYHFDLRVPELAYLFGFLQADGHLSSVRARGKIQLEIQVRDRRVLEEFQELLPMYSSIRTRTRDTNFKDAYESAVWTVYDQDLRSTLHALGLPYGPKSDAIAPPNVPHSSTDYFRGLLDGDGSLGHTREGFPFVSWCTSSGAIAEALITFLHRITGKKKSTSPNARDGAYNIAMYKEDAQAVARALYYDKCLALERKIHISQEVLAWQRPASMRKVTWQRKRWSLEEDRFILTHSVLDSAETLGRTERSVRVRLSRLHQQGSVTNAKAQ